MGTAQLNYCFSEMSITILSLAFLGGAAVKNLPANAEDTRDGDLIPGSGRSPGGGNGYPLWYSGLGEFHGLYSPWSRKELDTTE